MGELGSRLIRVREARGLTLEDAERDTRISRRYLDALEAEQFEVIPAPVYARGFLRSYSQYLGLDPMEMLALFPREGDELDQAPIGTNGGPSARPSMQSPVSPVSPSRPAWRRPQRPPSRRNEAGIGETPLKEPARRQDPPPQRPGTRQPPSAVGPMIGGPPQPRPGPSAEPMIGVDIGLPTPAHRINVNPAAQARGFTVLFIAIAAVVAVVLVALLISNLGGSDAPPGTTGSRTTTGTGLTPASSLTQTAAAGQAAGATVAAGKVPNVKGQNASQAKQTLESAGYVVKESRKKDDAARGTVVDQAPSGDFPLAAGQSVIIVVSDGP